MLSRWYSCRFGSRRARRSSLLITLAALLIPSLAAAFTPSGLLEIHHINVQQGDCTLVIGPDGTTVLIDAGNNGKGSGEVVPYLQSLGLMPADGIDYMIATHRDADHLGGLDEVINAGYDVHVEVWDNGSDKTGATIDDFIAAAAGTSAGPVSAMPLNAVIALGGGAVARCVAVNGDVLGFGAVSGATANENDMSVAVLVQYGGFDYVTAGDLGGGDDDAACTGRATGQVNVETTLATSLMPGGGAALLTADGVEVLDVNHHGSESSTNSDYMNLLTPSVAAINVGAGQGGSFAHPRIDIVEDVLLAEAACVSAAPALVLQTEEGSPTGSQTSFAGFCVGDIVIKTSGVGTFDVSGTGSVSQGPDERVAAGIQPAADFDLDGGGGGGTPLVVINEIMQNPNAVTDANGEWMELHNTGATSVDINGWTLRDDGTDLHIIASPVVIPAGGYAVLGRIADPGTNGGYSPDYVYTGFTLANTADEVVLVDGGGAIVDRVDYTGVSPWPNPTGASMEVISAAADNNVAANWAVATTRGGTFTGGGDLGTPGAANSVSGGGSDTTPPVVAVSAPNGAESWNVGSVHAIAWSASDNVGVTSVDLEYSTTGSGGAWTTIATGESNDGTYDWTVPNAPSTNTFVRVIAHDAAANSASDVSNAAFSIVVPLPQVVINEIMADPNAVSDTRGEWVELHNAGGASVNINGWTIRDDGADAHVIGSSVVIPAGGYVVLGRNGNSNQNGRYTEHYVYTNFTLGNADDEVVLLNGSGVEVDRVEYTGASPWPSPAGATMELISAASDNNLGASWGVAVTRGGSFTGNGDLGTPGATNSISGGGSLLAGFYAPPAVAAPLAFELGRSTPNPFALTTSIRYAVPGRARVEIEVFDLLGRRVTTLVSGFVDAGFHEASWNGVDASGRPSVSGVYFVRMRTDAFEGVRRILLAR
jgi:beta-lactamase superfamily II metal-dependent hydrolase